ESPEPTETILQAIARHAIADAIVRVRYHIDEDQIGQVDVARLREALKPAHAIAAIERTVDPRERERRGVVGRETSLKDALLHYIAQHEHLDKVKDDLVEAALELEAEYEAS